MKAKEYIQKKGWSYSIKFINHDPTIGGDKCELSYGEYENLKKFTDAYEFVQSYGGLFEAKELIRVSPKLTDELRILAHNVTLVEEVENYDDN